MPTVINGRRLGVARNGAFTSGNTDPIPGGRLWPEAARAWNDMRAAALADGIPAWEFMPAGPASSARTIAQQRYFWAVYQRGGNAAAYPGTSNHGWGIAVDVRGRRAVAWMHRHAHRFGWSHDEGRRVGEWWHWRYVGGYRPRRDPLAGYPSDEKRWIREYDELRRKRRDADRRRVLRRVMEQRRKEIWRAAQRDGRRGWEVNNRRRRYRSLRARSI